MAKITDNRSGKNTFYVGGGRNKDRSLSSMDSHEDKLKEKLLNKLVKTGERFVEQEHKLPEIPKWKHPRQRGKNK